MNTDRRDQQPLSVLVAVVLAALAGCGDEQGPGRLRFAVEVTATGGSGLSNDHGYKVTLSEARLHLGPIHFFAGEPLFTRRAGQEGWPVRLAGWWLGVRPAHAHPGHYQEGEALGELLDHRTVDLLAAGPTALGMADGVTGSYRSAQLAYAPSADNGGHAARARGIATKGSEQVPFVAHLDASDKLPGIACPAEVAAQGGTMRVQVDLARWVELIDFSLLDASKGEVTLAAGSQAHNAFTRGVHNTSAFVFTWKTASAGAR